MSGDVVVAVVEKPQVGEQVDDLLLSEVPAAGRPVRRQPLAPKRLLVALGVGAGGEEHDDLARLGLARVDELADAARDPASLAVTPVLARVREARLVGDEQLDRVPEDRIGELGGRRERLVVVAEGVPEQVVHRREHLRTRAVVACEREQARRLRPALAEDLQVGVAEAVDRLELVADGEDLGEIGMRDEVDELALEPVRVLELVDHDHPEAELRLLAHARRRRAGGPARPAGGPRSRRPTRAASQRRTRRRSARAAPAGARGRERRAPRARRARQPCAPARTTPRGRPCTRARRDPRGAPAASPRWRPEAPRRRSDAASPSPTRRPRAAPPQPEARRRRRSRLGRWPSSRTSSRPDERSVS